MTDTQIPWESSTKFVKVLCRIGLVTADGTDADQNPDLRSLGGKVTIKVNAKLVRYLAPTRGRMLVNPDMVYTIQPATGELVDAHGNVGLYVIDPLSSGVDPSGFTYTATVKPDQGDSWSCTFGGVSQLPAEVDLVRMATIAPSSGTSSLEQRVSALEANGGGGGSVDLSGYATDAEVATAVSGLASTAYVDEKVASTSVDLSGYATDTELATAVSGLASTTYVDEKVANASAKMTLDTALAGLRFTVLWDGANWTYAGQVITARPSQRTDIFFDYAGAPSTVAGPAFAQTGDRRYDA